MKLTVFHAKDGDCLLLSSDDGHHALIDGGRSSTFREHTWPTLRAMAEANEPLDLVVVSHIDSDHISGILWLLKVVAQWVVHDYQITDGNNPGFPEPRVARPPAIAKIWHNSWRDQFGDLAGPIESFAARTDDALTLASTPRSTLPVAVDLLDDLADLAQSMSEGVELLRTIDDETPIERNTPFEQLVVLRSPPVVERLGAARLTVVGPAEQHLKRLRSAWRAWLADQPSVDDSGTALETGRGAPVELAGPGLSNVIDIERTQSRRWIEAIAARAEIITETDPTKVTPPNRASITLLAEEGGRSCLLTGDAAEEEILEGLTSAGRIVDDRMNCDVVKVQHHGSEHNLGQRFARTVLADHYVFCADGAHGNPEPSVVRTLLETRLEADDRPLTVWFNCSPARTSPARRKAMRAAISEATSARRSHAAVTVNVLDDADSSFEISL